MDNIDLTLLPVTQLVRTFNQIKDGRSIARYSEAKFCIPGLQDCMPYEE